MASRSREGQHCGSSHRHEKVFVSERIAWIQTGEGAGVKDVEKLGGDDYEESLPLRSGYAETSSSAQSKNEVGQPPYF